MKLFVTQVANGNMTIVSEWTDNADGAIMAFHAQARNLRSDTDTLVYTIRILDEQMNQYGDYKESLDRTPEPEPSL